MADELVPRSADRVFQAMGAAMSFVEPAMTSSARCEWYTPRHVLELVEKVGPIGLDPCWGVGCHVKARVCVDAGGLDEPWPTAFIPGEVVWCNPPYGRGIGAWLERCRGVADNGGSAIALVPARTDTRWWNDWCAIPKSDAVCFWRGRLTFEGAPAPAPFPSALVCWGSARIRFADVFRPHGAVWL